MAFKPNWNQIDALTAVVRSSFSSDEIGAGTAALLPDIIRCVGGLITSATEFEQLGQELHTILMCLPTFSEETPEGLVEHYDLAPLCVRAQRAHNLTELMRQFSPGAVPAVEQELLSLYRGPSEPFGIQVEFYRAELTIKSWEHGMKVLAQLGVKSEPEDIGCILIEDIVGVSVWGNIAQHEDGFWYMALEVHDPHQPYKATYTAFDRACIVNQVLAKYLLGKL